MSLRLWLPLNGNIKQQGLSNVKMSGTFNSGSGPLGLAATFTGSSSYVIYDASYSTEFNYTDNFSWCTWIYNSYDSGTQYAFTVGRVDAGTYGYGILLGTDLITCRYGNDYWSVYITNNTWNHVAFTKSGSTIKIYLNGSLLRTETYTGVTPTYSSSEACGLGLGCFYYEKTYSNYLSKCRLQDFRIYDHCLSNQEISDIAKGLCIHLPLSIANNNLITNFDTTFESYSIGDTPSVFTNQGGTGSTVLVLNDSEVGKCLAFYLTTSGGRIFFTESTYKNKRYIIKAKIKCSDTASTRIKLERYGGDYSWTGNGTFLSHANTWETVTLIHEANTSDTTYYIMFYTAKDCTMYIKDIELIEYQDVSCNTSGVSENGTLTGNLYLDDYTTRYNYGMYFQGATYIKVPIYLTTNMTFSIWIKGCTTSKHILDARDNSGGYLPLYLSSNTVVQTGDSKNNYPNNTVPDLSSGWHLITVVYNSSLNLIYTDGVLRQTNTNSYGSEFGFKYLYIGSRYNQSNYTTGYLSDLRVYDTALSADDIKDLYQTSAFIDNTGNFGAYEIYEENDKDSEICKTGLIKADEISEYLVHRESDGSEWLLLLWHNNPASYKFTSSNCANYNDNLNLFSLLYLLLQGNNFLSTDSKYEFIIKLKETPTSTETVRRWTLTVNPYNGSTTASNTDVGFVNVSNASYGLTLASGNCALYYSSGNTNWFAAIGAYNGWSGGIPGAYSNAITTGYIELYVRIDNVADANNPIKLAEIGNTYIKSRQLNEL